MPKFSCQPCLGSGIKGVVAQEYPELAELLEEIPTCKRDADIELCLNEPRGKGGRKKRVPSKYNLFIGQCIKQNKSMKQCAAEYRRTK